VQYVTGRRYERELLFLNTGDTVVFKENDFLLCSMRLLER